MTLLARLGPRPKTQSDKPGYPRVLAFAAAALLGACGGVVTSPNQEGTSQGKSTPESPSPEVNTAGGEQAPFEPGPDAGTGGSGPVQLTGTGGYVPVQESGGAGGTPYVPPPEIAGAAPYPYAPDAGVVIPTEAAPPAEPDAGFQNPAGGEPVPFDAGVLAE